MQTHVEFRTNLFPPYVGEEDDINPGRFGKRLAEFLHRGLGEMGFETGEPIAEDWGWGVPINRDGFRLWIGCGNYDEYPEGGFLCFIEPHTPTIRKFLRKFDVSEHVEKLRDAIDALLKAEADVHDIRWWTHEEFNDPSGRGG